MRKLVALFVLAVALVFSSVASANYVQGVVQYGGNHAYANGYPVKLYQLVPCGFGCQFWANTQNTTSGNGGPGFYSFNVSGANDSSQIRVTSCGYGYGTGGWVQPGPFTGGVAFARLNIWYGIGC
jgi:hypothetical protein